MTRLLTDCDLSRARDRMVAAVARYLPGPFRPAQQTNARIPYPCLYAPIAHLFVASSQYQQRAATRDVEAIVRISKVDGVLVTPTDEEHGGVRFDVVASNHDQVEHYAGYALYLGHRCEPTLVAELGNGWALRIGRSGLVPTCAIPWRTGAQRLIGIARGAGELSAAVWGRPLPDEPVVF